jgi:hypothetical protein
VEPARVLVIANRTAASPELLEALRRRRERGPIAVTLLVPAAWDIQEPHGDVRAGQRRLDAAVRSLTDLGVDVDARLGDPDPVAAVRDTWRPGRFDEVIVSTLPDGQSRWTAIGLPGHAARITGLDVTLVKAAEAPTP